MTVTTGSATPPAATTAPGLAPTELRLSAELDSDLERLVEASYPLEEKIRQPDPGEPRA